MTFELQLRYHRTVSETTPRTEIPADATLNFHCRPKFSCSSEGEDAVWRESSTSVHTRAQSLTTSMEAVTV